MTEDYIRCIRFNHFFSGKPSRTKEMHIWILLVLLVDVCFVISSPLG